MKQVPRFNARYPYEVIPGHMASPARYTFQRHVYSELGRLLKARDVNILDFGCGPGTFRFYFAGRNYTGFDIINMRFAQKKEKDMNFAVADGTNVPFKEGSFDFVFCNAVLEHIEDNSAGAKEAARALKKGKYCMIIVPTKMSIIYDEIPFLPLRLVGLHGHADHYYSRKELARLVNESGMELMRIYYSMGFFSSLLKTAYIYARLPRYLFYNLLYKATRKENHKRDLYMDSMAKNAHSADELRSIHENEYGRISLMRWMYRKMLEACFYLDETLKINAGGEWIAVARRK